MLQLLLPHICELVIDGVVGESDSIAILRPAVIMLKRSLPVLSDLK